MIRRTLRLVSGAAAVAILCIVVHGCQGPNQSKPSQAAEPGRPRADAQPDVNTPAGAPPASIQSIVEAAQTWRPLFREWWGKPAPDFTLTDLAGKTHKLSDYRGKCVMVAFWASWCGHCKTEVPHLKELRSAFAPDDFALLALSNEPPATLEEFAREQGLNYTVLSNPGILPLPFGAVQVIPTTFFVNREGQFELAAAGVMPANDTKAIVEILTARR
jgi:peroxiredoxin